MTLPIGSFVRVAVVLAFGLLAMPLLRRNAASARRLVLTVSFGCALALPFVPAWQVNAPVYRGLVGRVVAEPAVLAFSAHVASVTSPAAHAVDWAVCVWAFGVVVVAVRFASSLLSARRLANRAVRASTAWDSAIREAEQKTGRRAVVYVSPEIEAPVLAGIVRPVVLVPPRAASWADDRKVAVLVHELAHAASHDLATQVVATIVCSLHWFDPLAWLAARRLRLERELAADEAVLRSGARPSSYAEDLLAIAAASPSGMVAIGDEPLPKRIAAIVAERRPTALGVKGASALVVATTVAAFGVACASTPASPATVKAISATSPAADKDLQAFAESELARATNEWKARGGTIVVMSPKGEVLADAGNRTDKPYVTGSTMKAILLAAAIDENAVTEKDLFDCSHGERAGKVLHDATPLGSVALPELLATSSNVGFAQVYDRVGGARLDRVLHKFNLATPVELAGAPAGDWNGALLAIGATMTSTPRQITRAYATLADGGDGIVKPSTAARVTALLEGVVASESGTGKKAAVAGQRVAGKTGTSDWTATDGTKVTYASFVGYVPADRPRYVIFVGFESPAGEQAVGGNVAAPVFARIATHALSR